MISSITEDCTLHYYRSGIKIEELRAEGNAEIKSGTERNFPVIWRILVGVPLYNQPLFRSLFLFFFLSVFPASCRIHVSLPWKRSHFLRETSVRHTSGRLTRTKRGNAHVVQCRRFEPRDRQIQHWERSRWAENVGLLRCETSYEGRLRGDRMLHGSWGTDIIKKNQSGMYRAAFLSSSH